ncbi:MAG TPA: penicillin-binding transpeptidase domain-containing protein [Kofleriaceae bacterium]|nr:penicillin-binding transpeptidase domain-containing protein [Kofleriaceae bacterium]
MRRSHVMLAGAVVVAGAAALLGSRGSTSAEVRGAPLEPSDSSIAAGSGAIPGSTPGASSPAVVAKRTAVSLSELLDLGQLTLAAGGDHYEAVLKDGRHAVLTLDPGLQAYAEKLLSEARAPRGAIVAMAPDGRILALAGRRGETPKDSGPKDSGKDGKDGKDGKAATDAGKDTKAAAQATNDGTFDWHLATDVWAPAASVFKLVTASALVAAGVTPDDKVCFHGGIRSVLESNLRDDKRDSRCESLMYGVAHSNNAILGKFAFQKLEPASLVKFSHELGLANGVLGSELTGSAGSVDIPAARDLSFAQTAAGFSGSQLSAVGGALLAATFADDGEQPVPRVIASIDGTALPVPARRRAVTPEVARAVSKMMLATCEMGSAAKSFGKHQAIHVAGKTGTLTRTEPFYMEHSWFVGYAPAESPQIVVSVVLGNPENWHLRGHEAARRLIDRAIGHDKDRTTKITSTRRVGW